MAFDKILYITLFCTFFPIFYSYMSMYLMYLFLGFLLDFWNCFIAFNVMLPIYVAQLWIFCLCGFLLCCREQRLGLTLLQQRQESSLLRFCLSWCLASTDTSLTLTWPSGKRWRASGMPLSQTKILWGFIKVQLFYHKVSLDVLNECSWFIWFLAFLMNPLYSRCIIELWILFCFITQVDKYLKEIFQDVITNLTSNMWRVRESW